MGKSITAKKLLNTKQEKDGKLQKPKKTGSSIKKGSKGQKNDIDELK